MTKTSCLTFWATLYTLQGCSCRVLSTLVSAFDVLHTYIMSIILSLTHVTKESVRVKKKTDGHHGRYDMRSSLQFHISSPFLLWHIAFPVWALWGSEILNYDLMDTKWHRRLRIPGKAWIIIKYYEFSFLNDKAGSHRQMDSDWPCNLDL